MSDNRLVYWEKTIDQMVRVRGNYVSGNICAITDSKDHLCFDLRLMLHQEQ